ncbi:DEAD/DEAH box helicase family protein [Glutamicibacter sp. FBE19]|uniref:DEAD/DEAH box helicase n=1 Tax=Glutamicibacter sp. FBE19 TaxID=2761534 RepID=UPI0018969FEF|nr:DEAD/DEAH box helicase family protein [Glutamicibacter sp. FBE19]MBF6672800.1 DEAD/DEAH box helicase family protein [Glutamicibacter sp. FBE19]
MATLPISLDQGLINQIALEFDLREPNKKGLRQLIVELTDDIDPLRPLVLDIATGVGKTYLMAAAVEYFRRQGISNVIVITPSLVVQNKTVQNFREGTTRYIGGFPIPPSVVSPQSYDAWRMSQTLKSTSEGIDPSMVFIFNVHQLVAPKQTADSSKADGIEGQRTKIRKFQEDAGSLYEYLTNLDDLIVIADESHLYGASAKSFNQALKDLKPAATIGLTASVSKNDNVIYRYPLYQAINDGYVKTPVLVFRKSGYQGEKSEERQLRDALSLLRNKEAAYGNYVQTHKGISGTKPALFVVCANVEHATQTAELLRGPGYCGSQEAVLQVDNEHDGEVTRKRLDELDDQKSPVRVVVSVDKLKEGWDTKRIAVMCTLRAMASEVLTQQTMGRGLRLPFGQRTGIPRIDQLDILAHTSFEELLNDENILQTFGLDGAIKDGISGGQLVGTAQAGAPEGEPSVVSSPTADSTRADASDASQGQESASSAEPGESLSGSDKTETSLIARELDDEESLDQQGISVPVTIKINSAFQGTTFCFPSTLMTKTMKPFDLTELEDDDIDEAAKRVSDSGEVLHRKKLVASRDKHTLKAERVEDVTVDSELIEADAVVKESTRRVVSLGQLTQSSTNITQLKNRVVPRFIRKAAIKDWTEKAKDSAVSELERLILSKIKEHASRTKTEITVHPVELPIDQSFVLPLGEDVLRLLDDTEQSQFKLRKYYGDWEKGLFPAASFDSWSAEYMLAMKLNYSEEIVWWKRLYRSDRASIAYSTRDNYYPDFVALDTKGIYWIVEGKSDKGRDDEVVGLKRKAAVTLVNKLISEPKFVNTGWGYLIAYESDVKRAESWTDLKGLSSPTVTEGYGH